MPRRKKKPQRKRGKKQIVKTGKNKGGNVSQVVNVYVSKRSGGRRQTAPKKQTAFTFPTQTHNASFNTETNELMKQIAPINNKLLEAVERMNKTNSKTLADIINKQHQADITPHTDTLTTDKLIQATSETEKDLEVKRLRQLYAIERRKKNMGEMSTQTEDEKINELPSNNKIVEMLQEAERNAEEAFKSVDTQTSSGLRANEQFIAPVSTYRDQLQQARLLIGEPIELPADSISPLPRAVTRLYEYIKGEYDVVRNRYHQLGGTDYKVGRPPMSITVLKDRIEKMKQQIEMLERSDPPISE